jgi:hypothetical protein
MTSIERAIQNQAAKTTRAEAVLLFSVGGVAIWRLPNHRAVRFLAGFSVDADGCPRAYHENSHGEGGITPLDNLGNAHGLLEKNGKRHKQSATDPAPGFFVSPTPLHNQEIVDPFDPRKYIDAATVPYISLPGGAPYYDAHNKKHHHQSPFITKAGARLGDVAIVTNTKTGSRSFAIWADIGPSHRIGEGSIALAEVLRIKSNPKHGGTKEKIVEYMLFPGSGNGWGRTPEEINAIGMKERLGWSLGKGALRLHTLGRI